LRKVNENYEKIVGFLLTTKNGNDKIDIRISVSLYICAQGVYQGRVIKQIELQTNCLWRDTYYEKESE